MDKLTPLEQEAKDVLVYIRDYFLTRHDARSPRLDYQEMLGRMRDTIVHLTNKEFGCASGKHAGRCDCREDYNGHSIHAR